MTTKIVRQPASAVRVGCGAAGLSIALALLMSSCAVVLPESGPSTSAVTHAASDDVTDKIQLIDLTDAVARRELADQRRDQFSTVFEGSRPVGALVGAGDTLQISIWEAPPALLFSPANAQGASDGATGGSGVTALPEQMVGDDGTVSIPFAGPVRAAGLSPHEIAAEIVDRLHGKAHEPQVLVRVSHNATSNVTIVGEVTNSQRMPLTAKSERLLDALAAAGGVRQPVGKTTIQLSRDGTTVSMPLSTIVADPGQNVYLRPGDVITALYQPFSFTVLGATGRNDEVNFEGAGITLAQALGRIGGLQDQRANPNGVFIFRFEDPAALGPDLKAPVQTTPDGRVAVVYRVDLRDPSAFFVAQSFPIRDKDILYVSNAPLADFQKFVGAILTIAAPVSTAAAATGGF